MRTISMVAWGAITLGGLAAAAAADTVHLTNGYRLDGEVQEQGESVVVRTRGGKVWVRRSQIERIERRETARQRFLRERSVLLREQPGDLDARVALAAWGAEHGLRREAEAEWQAVLDVDPGHPGANRALGRVWHAGEWMTPDERHHALGHVQVDGEWITAEAAATARQERAAEADLARVDAERRLAEARIATAEAEAARADAQAEAAQAEAERIRAEAARWRFETIILGQGRAGSLFHHPTVVAPAARRTPVMDPHTRLRVGWKTDPNDVHRRLRTAATDPCDPHTRLRQVAPRPPAGDPVAAALAAQTARAAGLPEPGSTPWVVVNPAPPPTCR